MVQIIWVSSPQILVMTWLVGRKKSVIVNHHLLRCVRGDLLLVTAFVFLDESKVRVLWLSVFFPSHALPPLACSALGASLSQPSRPPRAVEGVFFSVLAAGDRC